MKSKYNIGDIVTVKKQYDNGCTGNDYPCFFSHYMLERFGGKKVKIKSVHGIRCSKKIKLYTEDYYYRLNDDNGVWLWTDSMFQESELWVVNIKLVI